MLRICSDQGISNTLWSFLDGSHLRPIGGASRLFQTTLSAIELLWPNLARAGDKAASLISDRTNRLTLIRALARGPSAVDADLAKVVNALSCAITAKPDGLEAKLSTLSGSVLRSHVFPPGAVLRELEVEFFPTRMDSVSFIGDDSASLGTTMPLSSLSAFKVKAERFSMGLPENIVLLQVCRNDVCLARGVSTIALLNGQEECRFDSLFSAGSAADLREDLLSCCEYRSDTQAWAESEPAVASLREHVCARVVIWSWVDGRESAPHVLSIHLEASHYHEEVDGDASECELLFHDMPLQGDWDESICLSLQIVCNNEPTYVISNAACLSGRKRCIPGLMYRGYLKVYKPMAF